MAARQREFYHASEGRYLNRIRKYRKANGEKLKTQHKRYRERNRKKVAEGKKRWYIRNIKEINEENHDYRMRRRFSEALRNSKKAARRSGHNPCLATPKEIAGAFTGHCHNPACNRSEAEVGRKLHLDHCHESGVFRGWLCPKCNHILGMVGDDPGKLRALAAYLERFAREVAA